MKLSLTLLGTGTPTPLTHRAGSSYLVQLDDEYLLFDCGPGCVRRLLRKGISPAQITSLLLTHLHYDHCVDYGYLVLSRWDQGAGEIPELAVYGPEPTQQMTNALFGRGGAFDPDLIARTEHVGSHFIYEQRGGARPRRRPVPIVTEVAAGDIIERDAWRLEVAEVIHMQPQLTCLAYRLETTTCTIVFGGDTAPIDSLTKLAQGADVLLHMCHFINGVVTDPRLIECCSGHLDAAKTAHAAGVKTLVLVHLTEQMEQPGIRERILAEAAEIFKGNIIFGEDLLDVPLDLIQPEPIR
ncbi:MAG: MBL fold metallo-hydrolase [Chloroflexota bacterium]